MSVVDAFGSSDETVWSRAFTRTAHLLPAAALATLVVNMVDDIARPLIPSWLATASIVVMSLVYLTTLMHQAFARICMRCMQDVPADAGQQAGQRRWLLWMAHHPFVTFLVLAALSLAAAGIRLVFGETQRWGAIPTDLFFFAIITSSWTHHRLRPWCPYCRPWDDEGPHEHVPTPDPSLSKTIS